MSKAEDRAEQRALEAYPILRSYNDFQMVEEDINEPLREIYQEGYHQAEKDFLEQENIRVPRKKRLKWRKSTEFPDIKNDRWYIAVMTYRHKRWSLSTGEFVDNSKYPDYENPLWVQVEDDVKIMWKDVRKWCYYEELIDYITESWRR